MNAIKFNWIAGFFTILMLFQSCTVYQGDYSLNKAAKNGKKVKVKLTYNEYLLYRGFRYIFIRVNNYDTWTLEEQDLVSTREYEALELESIPFSDIALSEGTYYGLNDFNDRSTWVLINPNELKKVSKTERQTFKKIIYQEGHYFGVKEDNIDMDLLPIYSNQVDKVSQYDTTLSVLASILITPVVITLLLITPVEDDW